MSQDNKAYEKVNWIREQTLGATQEFPDGYGMKLSISERSGLVKVEIPGTGRRAPALYRDEILALLAHAQVITEYLERHQDVALSKGEASEVGKVKRGQLKTATTAAQALQSLGMPPEAIQAILDAVKAPKQVFAPIKKAANE